MPSMKHNLLALLVSGTALASIPASAQEANKPLELNTVVIQSDGNGGTTRAEGLGPVKGFVPRATITGSKDSVAIDKIPQSVSVVGRDQMDALGAQKIDEALRYTPGVLAQP